MFQQMLKQMNQQTRGGGVYPAPEILPPGYICRRCHIGGHFIKDCPQNGNPAYDPHNAKGIPKAEIYKQHGINTLEFKQNHAKHFRALLKQKELYITADEV